MKLPSPFCYDDNVIKTESPTPVVVNHVAYMRPLAPGVWLCQNETNGQFVEIVMPPFELNDLIQECTQTFPQYVIQLCEVLAQADPLALTPETKFSPELIRGLWNTQVLGTLLTRQGIREERALPLLPELEQAFGLAMRGRLRLTADPIPEEWVYK